MSGPHSFRVLWGRMGRPGFVTEIVEAWDADEALVIAAELHPELHRPGVAVPAADAWAADPGSPGPWRR